MNYEKEYNKLVGKIKKAHLYAQTDSTRAVLEDIYPELAESEDERIRKWIVKFLVEQYPECWKDKKNKMLAYLEKQKDQKPAEWSEEDEIMLKWIEDILLIADDDLNDKLNGKVSPITDSAYSSMKLCIAKCRSWLKSLRPSWKPTEHQMNILKAVKDYVGKGSGYWGEGLGSLIEDLKKL